MVKLIFIKKNIIKLNKFNNIITKFYIIVFKVKNILLNKNNK